MEIIDSENINEARKKIDKLFQTGNEIVVIAKDSDFNRKILENKKVNVLLFSNFLGNKNRLKQRDSGLNHVLCKIAKENDVSIGIDFSIFIHRNSFQLSHLLSSTMQNISLCSKYKVKILIFNMGNRDKSEIISFLLTLGVPSYMINKAFN